MLDLVETAPAEAVPEAEMALIEDAPAEIGAFSDDYAEQWNDLEATENNGNRGVVALATALITAFLGWTGFWGWANQAELLQPAAPARIVELIALWAVPSCLIALGWLLAMRLSTREANRFGDVAALLRAESEALENRMRTMNGEIALARSFLAENAREIESVGRTSAQRLTEAGEQLSVALADSESKSQMLEQASSAAITNLDLLRKHLPVVTSAAKDATNQIGHAGLAANDQVQGLIAALKAMVEAAATTSASAADLDSKLQASTKIIENAAGQASSALEISVTQSETRAAELLARLQAGIAEVELRIGQSVENVDALTETGALRLSDQLAQLQATIDAIKVASSAQDEHIGATVARLNGALQDAHAQIADADEKARSQFETLAGQLRELLDGCEAKLGAIDSNATDRIAKLAFAINALSESSGELTVNLSGNEERARTMLADAEKLMQSIDSDLPSAMDRLKSRFVESSGAVAALNAEGRQLEAQSTALAARFGELDALIQSQRAAIDRLTRDSDASLSSRKDEVEALVQSLSATQSLIADVSDMADRQLTVSLQRVAESARETAESSKAVLESELSGIADRLTEQNRALLAGAIDAQLAGLGSAVNEAIDRNLRLSEEATERVSAQLRSVSDLTTNLEQRAAVAREQFAGIDEEAFARRIALLTESLNSAAIDVAKILSNEVTDTAWAAYLKGDRGVFTRRAVRLLDSGEARIIATQYDEDAEFRDHVNRYIHDFESMMRVLLSTRDGNAIGVTLLSSDVGKLYVALAQAIDRLRG